jgi:hypothetical protein
MVANASEVMSAINTQAGLVFYRKSDIIRKEEHITGVIRHF